MKKWLSKYEFKFLDIVSNARKVFFYAQYIMNSINSKN